MTTVSTAAASEYEEALRRVRSAVEEEKALRAATDVFSSSYPVVGDAPIEALERVREDFLRWETVKADLPAARAAAHAAAVRHLVLSHQAPSNVSTAAASLDAIASSTTPSNAFVNAALDVHVKTGGAPMPAGDSLGLGNDNVCAKSECGKAVDGLSISPEPGSATAGGTHCAQGVSNQCACFVGRVYRACSDCWGEHAEAGIKANIDRAILEDTPLSCGIACFVCKRATCAFRIKKAAVVVPSAQRVAGPAPAVAGPVPPPSATPGAPRPTNVPPSPAPPVVQRAEPYPPAPAPALGPSSTALSSASAPVYTQPQQQVCANTPLDYYGNQHYSAHAPNDSGILPSSPLGGFNAGVGLDADFGGVQGMGNADDMDALLISLDFDATGDATGNGDAGFALAHVFGAAEQPQPLYPHSHQHLDPGVAQGFPGSLGPSPVGEAAVPQCDPAAATPPQPNHEKLRFMLDDLEVSIKELLERNNDSANRVVAIVEKLRRDGGGSSIFRRDLLGPSNGGVTKKTSPPPSPVKPKRQRNTDRTCSYCKLAGHNIRRCPKFEERVEAAAKLKLAQLQQQQAATE